MFETVFTLKQHTPILHFLHDQDGATLRATELKPKLDRFILNKFQPPKDLETTLHKAINKVKAAVDDRRPAPYRIVINQGNSEPIFYYIDAQVDDKKRAQIEADINQAFDLQNTEAIAAPFFANSDKLKNKVWEEIKLGIFQPDELLLSISTWDEDINHLMKLALPKMLLSENFGTRQSKGFGSFTCTKIDGISIENAIPELEYFFDWDTDYEFDHELLFKAIDYFNKCIRSGINKTRPVYRNNEMVGTKTEFYFKSLMYVFATSVKKKDWDKKTIKDHFYRQEHLPDYKKIDFRDWLGLSTDEVWRQAERLDIKLPLKKQPKTDSINRFPSPILFKPIQTGEKSYRIYFGNCLTQKDFDDFRNARIVVSMKKKWFKDLELKPLPDFDLKEYLEFIFEYRDQQKRDGHLLKFGESNAEHMIYRNFISPIFNNLHQNPDANHGK